MVPSLVLVQNVVMEGLLACPLASEDLDLVFLQHKHEFMKQTSDTLGNWLIDSGASRHLPRYKEALSNLIEKDINLEIILGDNATYPVKGVGNVTLQLNQGNTIHLQEVLYVPDLKKNLVSISGMEDK